MILLLLSLFTQPSHSMAPKRHCQHSLARHPFFSEFAIAKAIEKLGDRDGYIFALVIQGFDEHVVAKRFDLTPNEVSRIAHRGIDVVMSYKRRGL